MRFHVVLLAVAAIIASAATARVMRAPKSVKIDSAFRYQGNLYLVAGDEIMAVSRNGFERHVRVRLGDSGVPVTETLDAAVAWPYRTLVYFYGAENSYRNNQSSLSSKVRGYGLYREFLKDGGPDAASFKSGWFYLFKGCQYVRQRATLWRLGEPQPMNELGLPCDVDAAWTDEDTNGMTVLKGNQIWIWRDKVTGPFDFDEYYHLWSWELMESANLNFNL